MMTTEQQDDASCAPVERRVIRPGNGWKYIGGSVYGHTNGARIHMLGMIKLTDGRCLYINKYPECILAVQMIRINGGNRKRGLMAWAMTYNAELTRRSTAHKDEPAANGRVE